MERPGPEEAAELLYRPDLRAARFAARLAELPTPKPPIRGRKIRELGFVETLEGESIGVLHPNSVRALGRRLSGKQPLFDKFTRHYRVYPPTEESFNYYFEGAIRRNKKWSEDPTEQAAILADRKRQPRDVEDNLQRTVFVDRAIARQRRSAIAHIQRCVQTNQPVDPSAVIVAANAVEDFGFCLMDKENLPKLEGFRFFPGQPNSGGDELGGVMIGAHIAFMGQQASNNPEVLVQNPELLRLVRVEQKQRQDYWGAIYEASVPILGDRLTDHERAIDAAVDADVALWASISEAA